MQVEAPRKASIGKPIESGIEEAKQGRIEKNRTRSGSTAEYPKRKPTAMQKTFLEDA